MNKYIILSNVCLGTVLTSYVASCINIALPNIMQTLGFNLDSIVWVSLGYLLPYGSMLPLTGTLGDKFGPKRMYIAGLLIFTIATMLCGLAPNSTLLIIFRIFQGSGAAMLLPNAMSIIATTFAAGERSKALGLWSAMSALGTATGPTIGGYIIELFSWRAIFFSVIPLAAAGVMLSLFALPASAKGERSAVDYLGSALLLAGISCFLLALNQGQKEGWSSLYITILLYVAAAALILFPLVELYVKNPIVDMTLFGNSNFIISNIVGCISILVMYAGVFLLPFFLKTVLGYDSIRAGLTILPLSAAMMLSSSAGGWLVSRIGSRLPATLGFLLIGTALFMFHTIDPAYSQAHFTFRLLLFGMGLGFTMAPLTNCVVESVPVHKIGAASGVLNLCRIIGGGVGVVLASTLLNNRTIHHIHALNEYIQPGYQAMPQLRMLINQLWGKTGMTGSEINDAVHGIFTGKGLSVTQYAELKTNLISLIHRQASIQSFQDVFLILSLLCFASVILAAFLRSGSRKPA